MIVDAIEANTDEIVTNVTENYYTKDDINTSVTTTALSCKSNAIDSELKYNPVPSIALGMTTLTADTVKTLTITDASTLRVRNGDSFISTSPSTLIMSTCTQGSR